VNLPHSRLTVEEFQRSARADPAPPPACSPALRALWHDLRGEWDRAHACAQDDAGRDGAWVHAYLHRKEGDLGNAGYWYARARRPLAEGELDRERDAILAELLAAGDRP
jgi:hypothetical protein